MRRLLDNLYKSSLYASAFCLATIAALVGAQLAGRLVDGTLALMRLPRTDFVILSLAEISGYLLAGASFLALAPTLKAGAHIRVTMALNGMSEGLRRYAEIWVFAATAAGSGYMTWQLANFAFVSWRFDEVSTGVVRVPLCYPQAVMAIGAAVLTISLVDELAQVIYRGRPTFRQAEDAISLGKEG
jgi:TRAP-type C4-dicarboxylate transport system permease small subunit